MADLLGDLKPDKEMKRRCIEREVAMREKVYPRWVAQGKMSEEKARLELTLMRAVLEDYK